MFGFACNDTPELMPMTLMLSHQILSKAADLRKSGDIAWMRPDSKSQVTIEYENGKPVRIDTVVVSHQHDDNVTWEQVKEEVTDKVIKPILEPTGLFNKDVKVFINPTGRFVVGGPHGDSGLTGPKDYCCYGGMGDMVAVL